jgi:NAD(P)-dependent dehydrogenase (short-subunit alcohol dehydrogenase family)
VALCDVNVEAMAVTAGLCFKINPQGKYTTMKVDVANESDVIAWQEQVTADFGPSINFLFNNAGVSITGTFLDMPKHL